MLPCRTLSAPDRAKRYPVNRGFLCDAAKKNPSTKPVQPPHKTMEDLRDGSGGGGDLPQDNNNNSNNNGDDYSGSGSGDSCGGGDDNQEGGDNQAAAQHDVFGDYNLGFVMLVLLLLHLMQYAMRDPCTC